MKSKVNNANKANEVTVFFAKQAWVNCAWAQDVLLTADASGHWHRIQPNASEADRSGATHLNGPVLPSLVNAHSHAFQRAIVGLTERRSVGTATAGDDFWTWRDRMYSAANRISPDQLEAIASLLYAEMLAGGYTHVCEFHYLHNGLDGQPYTTPTEMSLALVRAAQRVGIGLTLLPTLYMRSGFTATGLRPDQQRFASTPDSIMRMVKDMQRSIQHDTAGDPCSNVVNVVNVGVALHSLRAVTPDAVQTLAEWTKVQGLPVHIHISEQVLEVTDCMAHTGQSPMDWLQSHVALDSRWNLVHATQATPAELQAVQAAGASVVICPATEANLGDGVFDFPSYCHANEGTKGIWSIGSDSHVTRSWPEELRLLEYSQRLTLKQRNIAGGLGEHPSSAAALFEGALAGGAAATGQQIGGLAAGNRADFVTLDRQSSALLGVPNDYLLDALVFSSHGGGLGATFDAVYVAGRQVVSKGQPMFNEQGLWAKLTQKYVQAMKALWG